VLGGSRSRKQDRKRGPRPPERLIALSRDLGGGKKGFSRRPGDNNLTLSHGESREIVEEKKGELRMDHYDNSEKIRNVWISKKTRPLRGGDSLRKSEGRKRARKLKKTQRVEVAIGTKSERKGGE